MPPIANLRMETFGNSGWFDPQEFTVRVPEKMCCCVSRVVAPAGADAVVTIITT